MFDGYWENGKALSDQAATQTLSKTNAQSNMLQAKAACLNAKVPLIKSSNFGTTRTINNGTTEFYGDCKGNDAYTGFVIWKQNNKPFLLNFLDEGKYCPSCAFPVGNEKNFVTFLPNGCIKGNYVGQCNSKNEPEGLGYTYSKYGINYKEENYFETSNGKKVGYGEFYQFGGLGGEDSKYKRFMYVNGTQKTCLEGLREYAVPGGFVECESLIVKNEEIEKQRRAEQAIAQKNYEQQQKKNLIIIINFSTTQTLKLCT